MFVLAGISQSILDTVKILSWPSFVLSLKIGKTVGKDIIEVLVIFRHVSFGASVGNGLLVTVGRRKITQDIWAIEKISLCDVFHNLRLKIMKNCTSRYIENHDQKTKQITSQLYFFLKAKGIYHQSITKIPLKPQRYAIWQQHLEYRFIVFDLAISFQYFQITMIELEYKWTQNMRWNVNSWCFVMV